MSLPHPPTTQPIWIDQPIKMEVMAQNLLNHSRVAVDTESNSLFAYREQVCLIQFSAGQKDYLLDTLVLKDLHSLAPIFASPHIEKVFHAAEYDLICLKRDFGFSFANLFDTMHAARVLGREAVGLGSMLESEFGIILDKRYQRANWGDRPLKPALLAYARLDSFYLAELRLRLEPALREAGRWEMAQEDFARLCHIPTPTEAPTPHCWRAAGGKEMTPRQAAILEALCQYREDRARSANLPPFKVLGNDSLLAIALAAPVDLPALEALDVLSLKQWEKHASGLLHAVERGMAAKPLRRISQPKPDGRYLMRLDKLRTWRKVKGKEWGVESDVILPRDKIESIAQSNPTTLTELANCMSDLPWRFEQFGAEIHKRLNGSQT